MANTILDRAAVEDLTGWAEDVADETDEHRRRLSSETEFGKLDAALIYRLTRLRGEIAALRGEIAHYRGEIGADR